MTKGIILGIWLSFVVCQLSNNYKNVNKAILSSCAVSAGWILADVLEEAFRWVLK